MRETSVKNGGWVTLMSVTLGAPTLARNALHGIAGKVEHGERVSRADGVALFESGDLIGIGHMADAVNRAKNGLRVTFAANQHINPTNICTLRKTCVFCSYARLPKEEGAYRYTMEQAYAEAAANPYVREFHIVGGLDMKAGLAYYSELFRGLKERHPDVHIKALTAVEIAHIARIEKMSVEDVLVALREAGLDTMPGGGAEVFSPGVRATIADKKLAVVQPNSTLVLGAGLSEPVNQRAHQVARERSARVLAVNAPWRGPLRSQGAFQRWNFALAATAAEAYLEAIGCELDPRAVQDAAESTVVPGRFQLVSLQPPTIRAR